MFPIGSEGGYSYHTGTMQTVYNGVLDCDVDPNSEFMTSQLRNDVIDWFIYMFPEAIGQCRVTPLEDIDFNFGSSAGALYPPFTIKSDVLKERTDEVYAHLHAGHVMNWVYPYQYKLKKELLPTIKCKQHRGRLFCVQDVVELARCLSLTQTTNEAICFSNNRNSPFMKGFNPFGGGTDEFAIRCSSYYKNYVVFKSDCTKWDKRAMIESKRLARDIRVYFIHMDDQNYYCPRADHMYANMMKMTIVMPDGNVFVFDISHPSGCGVTTDDNNIHHIIIIIDMFVSITGLSPIYMSEHFRFHCMSDDNLCVVNLDSPYAQKFLDFDTRAFYYKRHGRLLKKEEDLVYPPNTVDGCHWLGCDWLYSKEKLAWVGLFSIQKLVTSIGLCDDLDPDDYNMKVTSFCLLGCYNDPFWVFIEPIYLASCSEVKVKPKTRDYFQTLWLGYESQEDSTVVLHALNLLEQGF